MKGNNSLEFNEATMMEIVQYWLDNKFLNRDETSPKVAGVWVDTFGAAPVFEIRLESE